MRKTGRTIHASAAITVVAVMLGLSWTAAPANANQQDFCGVLLASQNAYPGSNYCSSSAFSNWTYVSNTYNGGGDIRRMRAGMCIYPSGACYAYNYADYTKFVNACYTGFLSTDFGVINQWETSGASHTLWGHMDDSPNHTHCIPIS